MEDQRTKRNRNVERLSLILGFLFLAGTSLSLHLRWPDNFGKSVEASIAMGEITICKTATWYCPKEMAWQKTEVCGPESQRDRICKVFEEQKKMDQAACPPGPPPSLLPATMMELSEGSGGPESSEGESR